MYKFRHGNHPQQDQRGPSKDGRSGTSLAGLNKVPIGLIIRLLLHSSGDVKKYDDAYAPSGDDKYSTAVRRLIVKADLHN